MKKSYMTKTKKLLHSLLKMFLEYKFEIEVTKNETKGLEAPYLLVGNHLNNWDGFLMSIYVNEPISFVISDEQFRNPVLRWLLRYINAIPTIKARPDISTIKKMIRAKKENRLLGLFPEGNRTWDGQTQPIYYSTAKLIKLLEIPVVITKFQGGHLASPRWAKHSRKGKIFMSYEILFSIEEIRKLSIDQIYEKLCQGLEHDEFAFQEKQMLPYTGKRLAEKLEYFLYACPDCRSVDQMDSTNNMFHCKNCGYRVEYTKYGFFKLNKRLQALANQTEQVRLYFKNPKDWNQWQLASLKSSLTRTTSYDREKLMIDYNVVLKHKEENKALKNKGIGQIAVDSKYFYFQPKNGEELIVPFGQIDGLNLQVRNQLDFYYKDQMYRLVFNKSNASPYKWLKTLEILNQELKSSKKAEA